MILNRQIRDKFSTRMKTLQYIKTYKFICSRLFKNIYRKRKDLYSVAELENYKYNKKLKHTKISIAIIICTNKFNDLIDLCLTSLNRSKLKYKKYIIYHNTKSSKHRDNYNGIEVIQVNEETFNFSKLNNSIIGRIKEDIILFLNNDTELYEKNSIKNLLKYFSDPSVGIVGAKLLYPDSTIQHFGVHINRLNEPEHLFVGRDPADVELHESYDVQAVTGACLAIRRSIFEEIGGFDENFPVDYNDIDLCFRVREMGYKVIAASDVVFIHKESQTRGKNLTFEKKYIWMQDLKRFQKKWKLN